MPRRIERIERIRARRRQAREDRLARIGRAEGIEQCARERRIVVRCLDPLQQRLDRLRGRGLLLLLGRLPSRSGGIGGLRGRGGGGRCWRWGCCC